MKISVIGTGYVGLVTGTCFAETGNDVICVEIDEKKVQSLRNGVITIYEPGLERIYERNLKEGRLKFTPDLYEGLDFGEVIFLALPTPPGEDGSADLSYILGVAKQIGAHLKPGNYKVIVDKSTVPVGTAEKVQEAIVEASNNALKAGEDFDIVSNPEFLREGVAVDDFMKPERVVVGTESPKAIEIMEDLYRPYLRQGNPIIFMDERSAELTKYAANSFLATKITFMNEIARLCDLLGADVDMVRRGIGSDSRIGKRFLFPGIGYGGSCFPKDVKALVKSAKDVKYDFRILDAVMDVNEEQKTYLLPRLKEFFDNDISGKTIAVWGLAFKPNTDDIREAPALSIIDELLKLGASVRAFDPEAMKNVKRLYNDKIVFADSQYSALEGADALLIATEWNEFRTPDFEKMKTLLNNPFVFDGRNLFEVEQMEEAGFKYISVGRKAIV